MKYYFTVIAFCFLTMLIACEDDKEVIDDPAWVADWIEEIEGDLYCDFCEIHRYEFEGAYYYELYAPVFSCLPCQVHQSNGVAVDSTFNVQDYVRERKDKTLIYKKD